MTMTQQHVEFGLDTFGDLTHDANGTPDTYAQVIRNVIREGKLADEVGIDFFGIGEHHREDFAVSSPETVLAAIATVTERIKLGSAVTVLSSDDPVRVFQRFATVDAASNGRAEVILGRGSFTESFPLFGYDLSDYERLFEEKVALFAKILEQGPIDWSGATRPPLKGQRVFPIVEKGPLTTWLGVGGSPNSVVRAAQYGLPLMLAIIGGSPYRFTPFIDLYREALEKLKQPSRAIGVHSPGYIAETDAQAKAEFWPHFQAMRNRIGKERGWGPVSEREYAFEIEQGSLYVGAPDTVARKLAPVIATLGIQRFQLKYSVGTMPHDNLARSIKLYGQDVVPMVKAALAKGVAASLQG
jgi:probable LLM family oxidoreductase